MVIMVRFEGQGKMILKSLLAVISWWMSRTLVHCQWINLSTKVTNREEVERGNDRHQFILIPSRLFYWQVIYY